jgi:hypothetical protein
VAVEVLMTERGFRVTRACGLVGISRSLYRYRGRRPDSAPLRARIEESAAAKRRYLAKSAPAEAVIAAIRRAVDEGPPNPRS